MRDRVVEVSSVFRAEEPAPTGESGTAASPTSDPLTWSRRLIAALADHGDARAALVAACDVVRELLPCDRVQIWRGDLRQQVMRTVVSSGYPPDDAERLADLVAPLSGFIVQKTFFSARIAFIRDTRLVDDSLGRIVFGGFGIAAAVMIVIEREGRPIGALQISWCGEAATASEPPSPEIVESIRHHFAIAIDFLARTDDALRLSETLSQTALLLGSIHEPDRLLATTVATIADAIGCDFAAIHLIEEDGITIRRVAQHGLPPQYEAIRHNVIVPGAIENLAAAMVDGVFEVPDASVHPETLVQVETSELASYFSVPLIQNDLPIGFLTLGYRERKGKFSRRQIALATGVAPHALAALRNARAIQSLREVSQVKTDFLAAVSHDLRTPLHVLLGYSDMLLEGAAGVLNPDQVELLTRLREGALRFRDLIDDVIDVARLDAGQDALVVAPVALAPLCAELGRELEFQRRPGVSIVFGVGDVEVLADGAKIKTVLRNLLSNALKFTRAGEVRVRAERESSDELHLIVSDTGPGIPVEDREHLFEMFQQGEAGRREGGSGLGLGLYLVKRLTEMLGGRVDLVAAEPGHTEFCVRLPVRSLPDRPDAPP